MVFCVSSRRPHTRCALVTGVQTCALPIVSGCASDSASGPPRTGAEEPPLLQMSLCKCIHLYTTLSDAFERLRDPSAHAHSKIGRESRRERVCQDGEISVVPVSYKNKFRESEKRRATFIH